MLNRRWSIVLGAAAAALIMATWTMSGTARTADVTCATMLCKRLHADAPIAAAFTRHSTFPVYHREQWPHWLDLDGDCQDTRAEILISSSAAPVKYKSVSRCAVKAGQWRDPYTGRQFFSARQIDIDHIVPLEWAHRHGGASWPTAEKAKFANDPANLLAVEDRINQAKGSQGPDQWLPPRAAYRCDYLQRFFAVVDHYGLHLSRAEYDAVRQPLESCQKSLSLSFVQ